MYKLSLILFAFFSLVFPILAIPIPVSNEIDEAGQSDTTDADAATGTSYSGRGTYYTTGLGACGNQNSDDQLVIAIPPGMYGAAVGPGPHCGQKVNIRYGRKSAKAMVVDKCPSCPGDSIDMSPALFKKFAKLAVGVIDVTWNFI
ncbi:RlpA-like double-psi beta-barrel-containing domain containing protein [Russula decolorans]